MLRTIVRRYLPPALLLQARRVAYAPLEVRDLLLGRYHPLRPPRWLHFVGGGDFETIGRAFLGHFVRLAGLQPHQSVLDVGCGVGRMALPLAGYLSRTAQYRGFDIVPVGVQWCQRRITPFYPNFRFDLADIYNAEYNPGGQQCAGEYRFPYADASFDFAFLTSVFTHMLPGDVAHYLAEIRRVLKPTGRCLATFFVLNDDSQALINAGKSLYRFNHAAGGCRVEIAERPEAAVAYEEGAVHRLAEQAGLRVQMPLYYGSWCGRTTFTDGQDLVLLHKF